MCFCVEYLNELAKHYKPLVDVALPIALAFIAWKANAIANSNLELAKQEKESRKYRIAHDDRLIFQAVYKQLSDAFALIKRYGRVTDDAMTSIWIARDRARLELPDDTEAYMQKIFDMVHKAWSLNQDLYNEKGESVLPAGEERTRIAHEHSEIITQISNSKPHESFSKYMKIKT